MTPDRWSDLEALAEKATPGPWVHATGTNRVTRRIVSGERPKTVADVRYVNGKVDAAYIVALVNAAPDLIREARRCAALTEALQRIAAWNEDETPHAYAREVLASDGIGEVGR